MERDVQFSCHTTSGRWISTHTLTWSVTYQWGVWITAWAFQLTRSRGAWPVDYRCLTYAVYFNSHAHVERDSMPIEQQNAVMNFNSHAHVERDTTPKQIRLLESISTHTLTWSVTLTSACIADMLTFQLTRSRGAWPVNPLQRTSLPYFNSHAHVERDRRLTSAGLKAMSFQLTRSRGAWRIWAREARSTAGFQLTRSRGAWRAVVSRLPASFNFNSHAHVERDQSNYSRLYTVCHFNSHAHVERD